MRRHQCTGENISPNDVNEEELCDIALSSGEQYCARVRIQPGGSSALGSKRRHFVSKEWRFWPTGSRRQRTTPGRHGPFSAFGLPSPRGRNLEKSYASATLRDKVRRACRANRRESGPWIGVIVDAIQYGISPREAHIRRLTVGAYCAYQPPRTGITTHTIFGSTMSQLVHEAINMAEIPRVETRTGANPAPHYHGPISFTDTTSRSPTAWPGRISICR